MNISLSKYYHFLNQNDQCNSKISHTVLTSTALPGYAVFVQKQKFPHLTTLHWPQKYPWEWEETQKPVGNGSLCPYSAGRSEGCKLQWMELELGSVVCGDKSPVLPLQVGSHLWVCVMRELLLPNAAYL